MTAESPELSALLDEMGLVCKCPVSKLAISRWLHHTKDCPFRLRAQAGEVMQRVMGRFDFLAHLQRQREWSGKTFGPGSRAKGVVDHIRKELKEIEADPTDLKEWIDVVILGLDGAWRSGASPEQIIEALSAKQAKNESRKWPDWRTASPDTAIEHDRTADQASRQSDADYGRSRSMDKRLAAQKDMGGPLCEDCGHVKNDSRFHFEAPGKNWGAALHHFRQPEVKK